MYGESISPTPIPQDRVEFIARFRVGLSTSTVGKSPAVTFRRSHEGWTVARTGDWPLATGCWQTDMGLCRQAARILYWT